MVSILTFDSRSLRKLLSDDNSQYFQTENPLFYKNKIVKKNNKNKFYYRSAIDSALKHTHEIALENTIKENNLRAITIIVNYVVKYQNNFVSSFLFLENIYELLEKGI
jgi:hypothetical protein